MSRYLAQFISFVFHPLFMMVYVLLILMRVNPFLFNIQSPEVGGLLIIRVVITTVFFPMVAVALMKMLGLIQSIQMQTRAERVGPLIVTGIFYIWMFLNIKNNDYFPEAFTYFVLGSTIALFLAFFLNNFTKISLHGVGVGGVLIASLIIYNLFSYNTFKVGAFTFNSSMLVFGAVLITGLVSTARLYLMEHSPDEVYGGIFIGAASQFIAYAIMF